jgi:hypothetical protein
MNIPQMLAVLLLSVTTAAGDADQAGGGPGGMPADIRAAKDNELLATDISRARVSEPEQMAVVLEELRLESIEHLGRLDEEERSEMVAAMRRAGVALGDRNKLRLLALEWGRAWSVQLSARQGPRRVQENSAQPTSSQATGGAGLSSDSAPPS